MQYCCRKTRHCLCSGWSLVGRMRTPGGQTFLNTFVRCCWIWFVWPLNIFEFGHKLQFQAEYQLRLSWNFGIQKNQQNPDVFWTEGWGSKPCNQVAKPPPCKPTWFPHTYVGWLHWAHGIRRPWAQKPEEFNVPRVWTEWKEIYAFGLDHLWNKGIRGCFLHVACIQEAEHHQLCFFFTSHHIYHIINAMTVLVWCLIQKSMCGWEGRRSHCSTMQASVSHGWHTNSSAMNYLFSLHSVHWSQMKTIVNQKSATLVWSFFVRYVLEQIFHSFHSPWCNHQVVDI